MIARLGLAGLAVVLIGVGGLSLAVHFVPEDPAVISARQSLLLAVEDFAASQGVESPRELRDRLDFELEGVLLGYVAAPAGLLLLLATLLSGRGQAPPPPGADPQAPADEWVAPIDKKAAKRARKQASSAAKSSGPREAAELCFQSGLFEEAASYFIKAGDFVRAAEIRHDQNRFIESAELYLQAESWDTAATIFSRQGEHARAAEAYERAGNQSVAAEMYETGEDWRNAARCYEASEFPRHAAKAYVRCAQWKKAAQCLEQVLSELLTSAGHADPKREAEARKMARMAGDLYTRASAEDEAQAILERGGCFAEAAEVALRNGREERAAELFLRANDPTRAAKVFKSLGREEESLRVLAEHHRDRGEDEQAAQYFEQAGEHMAAGDLYRLLERYEDAASCYERQGEYAQAAEMFRTAGNRERAAENYERGGLYREAAECCALAGQHEREADLLAKAGDCLRAGEILHKQGRDDESIKVLQQVTPEHADFPRASAILGDIFRERGMVSLAIKKLTHAIGDGEVSRDNVAAFYGLASVYEANGKPQEALELFEKILAYDYNYQDVGDRVATTRETVRNQLPQERADSDGPLGGSQEKGRYRITGKLGRGGMGIVYKASDTRLDRTVAFKVLPDTLKENPQALKNFLREAKSAAQLNHPNIVQVYDAGEQDGIYYIAMEYVDGNTLKEIVKHRGRISTGGIVHVLTQLSEGLAYAHEQKIVHRDVKTANTMWTRDRKAKIMDFGLAKAIEEVRNHTTVVSGTPYYMSPEQTLGKNIDHRTDIYSLGVTIFELATGTLPFREGNLPYHHVHTPPPDPREFNPDLPQMLVDVINRCLCKDPDDRYQSTREILEQIQASLPS